jgi:putative tricarboxylic transport membrane protein
MELFSTIGYAFQIALTPENIFWCAVGVTLGTLIGVLPGVGPTSGIAMLLPITTLLPPVSGIIMLAGIYYGAQYGGSTTSILVNIPGEVSSVTTCFDGYPLAKAGKAGHALAVAAIASFVAGTLGLIGLTFFAPPLADLAFALGLPEYFLLMVLALTIVISLAGKSVVKGMVAAAVGLLTTTVGLDAISGTARFSFGSMELMSGLDFVAASIGLFAIGEVLMNAESGLKSVVVEKVGSLYPSLAENIRLVPTYLRSTAVGFFLGLMPGISPSVTSFMAYDLEKRVSKHPERFGTGVLEGVAAPEGANNACSSGGFIPLMAFGIPPSPALAVLLGAFIMYGLQPGPVLFQQHPEVVWGLIASMYVGNVMLLVLNLPLVRLWVKLLEIPYPILSPLIIVFSLIGAFSLRNNFFDLWTALLFGLVGYAMKKLEIPVAPLVLCLILGDKLEALFRQSLTMSGGEFAVFVRNPLCVVLIGGIVFSLGLSLFQRQRVAILTSDGVD